MPVLRANTSLTTQDEVPLLNPNVLICSVGTEIFYRGPDGQLLPDHAWEAYLDKGWDRAAVEAIAAQIPQLKPQVSFAYAIMLQVPPVGCRSVALPSHR